jgi:hypothetical protein
VFPLFQEGEAVDRSCSTFPLALRTSYGAFASRHAAILLGVDLCSVQAVDYPLVAEADDDLGAGADRR